MDSKWSLIWENEPSKEPFYKQLFLDAIGRPSESDYVTAMEGDSKNSSSSAAEQEDEDDESSTSSSSEEILLWNVIKMMVMWLNYSLNNEFLNWIKLKYKWAKKD